MDSFNVELGPNPHQVHVGADLLALCGELARKAGLTSERVAILSDTNVARLYGERVRIALEHAGFKPELIEIPAGETSKSLAMLARVYDRLVAAELDRGGVLFALGGGVVGDLGGFAAATYLRGIALVQLPTTIIAQVDSALGGKTGINHDKAKNLIGAFYQPRLIIADTTTLESLPEREFREGLAEVIKYGAIMDAPMLTSLEREMPAILRRDAARLEMIIAQSLRHKAAIVVSDEREGGPRKLLNFGHTIGHALEAAAGYGSYFHGEAVAVGMVAAARLSCAFAGLGMEEAARLQRLIEMAGLPTTMPPGWFDKTFVDALRLDKKRSGEAIEFVLLDRLGHALTRKLGFDQILAQLSGESPPL
ncbi:MAG: 3-dehydroquinate synthase [Candidatus Binataceae bacterium]